MLIFLVEMALPRIIKLLPGILREKRGIARGFGGLRKPLMPNPARWHIKTIGELIAGQAIEEIQFGSWKKTGPRWENSLADKKESKAVARERFVGRLRAMLGARSTDRIDFYKYKGAHYLFVYPTLQVSETKIELHKNLGVAIKITNREIIDALDYLG
jgi:hypothetical protein